MFSIVLSIGMKLFRSKFGPIVFVIIALFIWHKFDKSSAIRKAVNGYVASVELDAANSLLVAERLRTTELERRDLVSKEALEELQVLINQSEEEQQQHKKEIYQYDQSITETPHIPIDPALFDQLLNN